jgi:SAM-dependent methyltransferase
MSDFRSFEIAGWRAEGKGDGYDALVARVTARVAPALLDAARVGAASRVLDVATGTGVVAAAAAARGASVVGIDISESMLARARALLPEVDFRAGDAEALEFEDDSFDGAVAGFVLHHLAKPERALAEMGRVAGTVAVAVWDEPERARIVGLMSDAAREAGVGLPASVEAGPSREELARDEGLCRVFAAAGLPEPELSTIAFTAHVASIDELWEGLVDGSVRIAAAVHAADAEGRARVRAAFGRLAEAHRTADGYEIPVSVRIAAVTSRGGPRARGRA